MRGVWALAATIPSALLLVACADETNKGSSSSTSTSANDSGPSATTSEPSLCEIEPIVDVVCGTIVETAENGCWGTGGVPSPEDTETDAEEQCAEAMAENDAVQACVDDARARGLGYSFVRTRDVGFEVFTYRCQVQADGKAWVESAGSWDLIWWDWKKVYQGNGICDGMVLEVCLDEGGDNV